MWRQRQQCYSPHPELPAVMQRKQDLHVYLCIQQRISFKEVVEGKLPCTQLGWEVLVGGEGPAWAGGKMIDIHFANDKYIFWEWYYLGFFWFHKPSHLDPPEWHAAARSAASADRDRVCLGHADAGAACGGADADRKEATKPPHVCSWEHLRIKKKDRRRHSYRQANECTHTHTHIIHLGRAHGITPSCLAEQLFCLGLLVFSPTGPEHLWSTGPLPDSSVSSCVCAVHHGSLPDNQSEMHVHT